MSQKDAVTGFSYDISTVDGCVLQCRYQVHMDQVKQLPGAGWKPMTPTGPTAQAALTTHYASGKSLSVDLDGDEHVALQNNGRFEKMLASILRGNTPGEALKRQITKAYDLPKLPKLKRARMS